MSTAFTAALPLIEELKTHLTKLKSVTDEIAKAKDSAQQNQDAAKQNQAIAAEVIGAANRMVTAQEGLVEKLSQQQQAGLGEQELLLRVHAEELSKLTAEQAARQLDGLKQTATAAQGLIDKLLQEQPPLLAAIGEQYQRGLDKQQGILQKGVQTWSDSLHQQMQTELKLLRQVIESLQKNALQQHNELSSIANQLQVVAGRVTAFAEVMNAAKFTTRLESIEQVGTANATVLDKLTKLYLKQGADFAEQLQEEHRNAAEAAEQHRNDISEELIQLQTANEQQTSVLQSHLEQVTDQLVQASKQQRLWQLVTIAVVVAVGAVLFALRHG